MIATQVQNDYTDYPRRWFAAVVMMIAALMDMIDVAVVNVALPTVRRDLQASGTQLEWVISAYLLAFAAILITSGNLGDRFGHKRVFLIGIAVFGLASLGSGLAQTANELIAGRVVQGTAAALMMPQVLATYRATFSGKERGQAFGLYGAVGGLAAAVGVLLGGVLVQADVFGWSWRTIFFVNLPVALFSLIAAAFVVPETRDRSVDRLDLPGAVLLVGALVAIVYPLLEGRALGWPAWIFVLLTAGIVALVVLFVIEDHRQRSSTGPLLQTRLFRIPAFSAGLAIQLLFSVALQGFFLIFTLWLQIGQHFSPLRAGITLVAFSVGAIVGAPVAIPLAQRYGRLILVSGAVLLAVGVVFVDLGASSVGVDTNAWPAVPGQIIAGLGLAFLVIPLINVVLAAAPTAVSGGASGLFSTMQQLGGAIGVAMVGTVFFDYASSHSFIASFRHAVPVVVAAFLVCGVLSFVLPGTAVAEDYGE